MTDANPFRHPVPVVRGQYQLTNPDTGTVQKLQRVTNRIGILADRSGLNKWLNRTALAGAASDPDLIRQINEAAQAEDNRRLDDLAEAAREAGGGNAAAQLGTKLHTVFERFNLYGTRPTDPTHAKWLDGVIAAMDAAGFTVQTHWVERVVANFNVDAGFAGQIDAAVSIKGDADTFLIDLKTGKDVRYGLNEYCLQLATYASATHYWDPDTNTCTPIKRGELSGLYGYIIHAPVNLDPVTIYELDLTVAEPAAAMIDQIKAWRKTKVGEPIDLTPAPVELTPLGWITQAAAVLADNGCLEDLAQVWPPGVPTLRAARVDGVQLSPLELDAIHEAISTIAATHQLDFFDSPYPGDQAFVPGTDKRIVGIKNRLAGLPEDLTDDVLATCKAAGVPKLTEGKATQRHLQIVWDTLEAAEAMHAERYGLVNAHLEQLPFASWSSALRHAGIESGYTATSTQVELLGHLADAYFVGILEAVDGQLVLVDGANKKILEHFGGKRHLLEAARQSAKSYGLERPTSSAQVEADLVLLATVFITVAPLTQTETSTTP